MSKKYNSLPVTPTSENNTYAHPPKQPELVHLNDPAQTVMMNFEHIQPLIAHPTDSIDETLIDMKASGTHIMLVVDDQQVVGIISTEDIIGEKPMQIIRDRRVKREAILVRAVMTPIEKTIAIDFQELRFAKVGQIISTFREQKQHYTMIVDVKEDSKKHVVHGLIYIYDIIKRLDKSLTTELSEARSVIELQRDMK